VGMLEGIRKRWSARHRGGLDLQSKASDRAGTLTAGSKAIRMFLQVAILGVSTSSLQPEWDGQQFVPKLVMPLSLTYDHRVIDGADGARFLRWICKALENPLHLVMKG